MNVLQDSPSTGRGKSGRRSPLTFGSLRAPLASLLLVLPLAVASASCGPPSSKDSSEILSNLSAYYGKRVVMRAKFRSGARCHQESADKKWQTYCTDCQVCRGPIVLDTGKPLEGEDMADWPLILGGTYRGKDIRCKGKLNEIDCYPFKLGKTYVVKGEIEHQRPPKLLVEDLWEIDEGT